MTTEYNDALSALTQAVQAANAQTAASQALAGDVSNIMVTVNSQVDTKMAEVDTQLAAKVAEVDAQISEAVEGSGLVGITAQGSDFIKQQTSEAAFYVDGSQLKNVATLGVNVGGTLYTYEADAVVALPSMAVGTDYAVYATGDGLIASANFTVPDGYTAENSRRIGGFHYQNGEINEYSIYDLKYRPNVRDPRGMVRSPMGIWADIYLLNATPEFLGTSAYNATIADGSTPPKVPTIWGGDGTTQYDDLSQYTASRVLAAFGKRLPTSHEFEQIAFGTTTGYVVGSDPVTTKFDASAKSMIGCEQVSGHMYQWGAERGVYGADSWAYQSVDTNGEGAVYAPGTSGVRAPLLGGHWSVSGSAGARYANWTTSPWTSNSYYAARGVCDHFESC